MDPCQILVVKIVSRCRFYSKWNILDNLYGFFRTDKWTLNSHFSCKHVAGGRALPPLLGHAAFWAIISIRSEWDRLHSPIDHTWKPCVFLHSQGNPLSICIRRGVLTNIIIQPIWWRSDLVFPYSMLWKVYPKEIWKQMLKQQQFAKCTFSFLSNFVLLFLP